MPRGILERLGEGVVLGDGGYLLELERRGSVQAGPFVPEVSLTRPEALAELHREYVHAVAEVIQTLTFYASEDKLATVGLEGKVDDMNRAAVRTAREVASEDDVLVAGNLSETWAYDPDDPTSHRHVRDMFDRQLAVMTEEGVDFVIAETFLWLGEAQISAFVGAGHGFKFASLAGKILSEPAIYGKTQYQIDAFRVDRPALTDPAYEPVFAM
jgi:betaine-homocysteine S-methyltransferase